MQMIKLQKIDLSEKDLENWTVVTMYEDPLHKGCFLLFPFTE